MQGSGCLRFLLLVALLAVLLVAGVWYYNKTHLITAGDRLGKAIDSMPSAVSRAAEKTTDKDAFDKMGEAIRDTGHAASSALSETGKTVSSAASKTSADARNAADKQKQEKKAD